MSIERVLRIDETLFRIAFEQDVPFGSLVDMESYLDLHTGEIIFIDPYNGDETEVDKLKNIVNENQSRYLEIPGIEHGDYHEMLQEFLITQPDEISTCYFDSIGGFKKRLIERLGEKGYEAWYEWEDFKWKKVTHLMEDFLHKNGVIFSWK